MCACVRACVCVCVNITWCSNYIIKRSSCTADVEVLCIQCRPYCLPLDISSGALIVVHIPPNGDKTKAVETIVSVGSKVERPILMLLY